MNILELILSQLTNTALVIFDYLAGCSEPIIRPLRNPELTNQFHMAINYAIKNNESRDIIMRGSQSYTIAIIRSGELKAINSVQSAALKIEYEKKLDFDSLHDNTRLSFNKKHLDKMRGNVSERYKRVMNCNTLGQYKRICNVYNHDHYTKSDLVHWFRIGVMRIVKD